MVVGSCLVVRSRFWLRDEVDEGVHATVYRLFRLATLQQSTSQTHDRKHSSIVMEGEVWVRKSKEERGSKRFDLPDGPQLGA